MFEIGIALAWEVPTILLSPNGAEAPFDFRHITHVPYGDFNDPDHCDEVVKEIRASIEGIITTGYTHDVFRRALDEIVEPRVVARINEQVMLLLCTSLTKLKQSFNQRLPDFENEYELSSPEKPPKRYTNRHGEKKSALQILEKTSRDGPDSFAEDVKAIARFTDPGAGCGRDLRLQEMLDHAEELNHQIGAVFKRWARASSCMHEDLAAAIADLEHLIERTDIVAKACQKHRQS